jgi:hypothetical protein
MDENTASRDNGRRRPKGYADWSPRATTRVILEQVDTVFEEYTEHLPLTIRQVFYRLVASSRYPKTVQAYENLSEKLNRARRAKVIPFSYLRDDGIVHYSPTWYEGTDAFLADARRRADGYRRDRQDGQDRFIELWCESAGMAPQLARAVEEFSVPVFSAGGFNSLSATYKVAERALRRDVPTLILHVGDFDPSGESIFESFTDDAAKFVEADRLMGTAYQRLDARRVSLTAEQVARFQLPTAPPKSTDSRSARWDGQTCQLEALAPDVLARIVRGAVMDMLDPDALAEQKDAEQADRRELRAILPAAVAA